MTTSHFLIIVAAGALLKVALNIGNAYYWKPKMEIAAKLLSTVVEYPFILPLYMKIKGRFRNREVQCNYNAMFISNSILIKMKLLPTATCQKEPFFMVSYKKPTENTVRMKNEVAYFINTGTFRLKKYTADDFINIFEELIQATTKMEQERV